MTRKINVAVLMGGNSTEHDISLISGREVVKNLNPNKYKIFPVVISRDGRRWDCVAIYDFLASTKSKIKKSAQFSEIIKSIDVAFIALHGANGEDGKIQAYLELENLRYTGSGVLSSALCMDKEKTKIILESLNINVPKGLSIKKGKIEKTDLTKLKFPTFVKPNSHGSSVGSAIANNKEELKKCLSVVSKIDEIALVEEFVQGTEITASILGTKNPKALPLIEIVSKNTFFDYESKYDPRLSEEICPARISQKLTKESQKIALSAYQKLECKSFARVDMIIKNSNIYVLEINTIPGLTPVSLFPQAAAKAGITYPKLLDLILQESLPHSLIQS